MNLKSLAQAILPPILQPTAWTSTYESANTSSRRGDVPGYAPTDGRREMPRWVRTELVRKMRYLNKNSGFMREIVGNMQIYSAGEGIKLQANTESPEWNAEAEELFYDWAENCEVTDRFSFDEVQGLVCRGMDVDGEYFCLKTRKNGDPRLQLIESHRVGDGTGSKDGVNDGVILDPYGSPIAYRVILDDGKTVDMPAAAMLHIFEPELASMVRNAPALQHSVNHILDEIELLALEKHAVKDNADVARVLQMAGAGELDENGDFVVGEGPAGSTSDAATLQKIVGGKLVKLEPGEELKSFESKRPSPTFTGFLEHLRRDSSLGLLPYEFAADPSNVGGASVRLVVAKADRRFSYRQMILKRRLLRPTWQYVIADAIDRKLLAPQPKWWKVQCVTPRRVTVDAGRESQQNREDVQMGLKNISTHYAELGEDFGEALEKRAADAKMILEVAEKYGIPVSMLWNPTTGLAAKEPGER